MNILLQFENMKKILSSILTNKIGNSVDFDELSINYKKNLDDNFIKELNLLNNTIFLLNDAHKRQDELAAKAALLILRTHTMGITDYFVAITNDIETILNKSSWEEFPENYKIPDNYNFKEE